jgi:hypothetical protein
MTSPQPVTFELESFEHLEDMIDHAATVDETLPTFPQRPERDAPGAYEISDGCIALTEGMASYGS